MFAKQRKRKTKKKKKKKKRRAYPIEIVSVDVAQDYRPQSSLLIRIALSSDEFGFGLRAEGGKEKRGNLKEEEEKAILGRKKKGFFWEKISNL